MVNYNITCFLFFCFFGGTDVGSGRRHVQTDVGSRKHHVRMVVSGAINISSQFFTTEVLIYTRVFFSSNRVLPGLLDIAITCIVSIYKNKYGRNGERKVVKLVSDVKLRQLFHENHTFFSCFCLRTTRWGCCASSACVG